MSRVIRVDDEVYEELRRRARGFETRNDVVRRVLKLAGGQPRRPAIPNPTEAEWAAFETRRRNDR